MQGGGGLFPQGGAYSGGCLALGDAWSRWWVSAQGGAWSQGVVSGPGGWVSTQGVPGPGGCLVRGEEGGDCSQRGDLVWGPARGGAWSRGRCLVEPSWTATAAGGMHPTGMHSCLKSIVKELNKKIA